MIARKILRCKNCGDEIEKCDGCGYRFEEGDSVICYSGTLHYHFCSENCMNKYLGTSIVSTIAVFYDEDE